MWTTHYYCLFLRDNTWPQTAFVTTVSIEDLYFECHLLSHLCFLIHSWMNCRYINFYQYSIAAYNVGVMFWSHCIRQKYHIVIFTFEITIITPSVAKYSYFERHMETLTEGTADSWLVSLASSAFIYLVEWWLELSKLLFFSHSFFFSFFLFSSEHISLNYKVNCIYDYTLLS